MDVDVVVIGGGIAGVSAAAHLAPHRRVVLLEAEAALAHHTTGRSAAQFLETYGGPVNRLLTVASRQAFTAPPAGTTDGPLLTPRPLLAVGDESMLPALTDLALAGGSLVPDVRMVEREEALALCPALRPERVAAGVLEPGASDIDVMGLHQSFVRRVWRHDGEIVSSARVSGLDRVGGWWRVRTTDGDWRAPVVVNAAGAWADRLAALAGVRPVGVMPLRRTAFMVPGPERSRGWPLVNVVDETLYFKPESGAQLLVSPADEGPSEACDARVDELDVARALDRLEEMTTLGARHVRATWAGLRTFVADRRPVIGPDEEADGFVWMVGQGGAGIQTAPAAGRLVASLVLDGAVPGDLGTLGLRAEDVAPDRPTLRREVAEGRAPDH